jgi:hypothetical protein
MPFAGGINEPSGNNAYLLSQIPCLRADNFFDNYGRSLINSGVVEAHEEICLCPFVAVLLIHRQEGNICGLLCYNSAL